MSVCVAFAVRDESFQIPMDLAMLPDVRNVVFYSPWQIAHGDITAYDPQSSKIGGGAFGNAYLTTYRRQQVCSHHGQCLWPTPRKWTIHENKRLLNCCGQCVDVYSICHLLGGD